MLAFLAKLRKLFVFLTAVAVVAEMVLWRRAEAWGVAFFRPWLAAIGAGTVCVGALLRAWAAGHIVKREAIAAAGPYRHVRHPLYLGSLLIGIGFGLFVGDGLVLGCVAVYSSLFYTLAILDEEAKMTARFGEAYRAYARSTGRLLPRPGRAPPAAQRFDWRLFVHNNGYMAFIYAACALLAADIARRVNLALLLLP
ncbi:MAG: isoprenylcysteine carboxylmethyltransferase family protein [Planctomycetes bacterium]|nr:isoprenylcysteine carboxylmethyltransferase family protein [Planctomycetota bacterium]